MLGDLCFEGCCDIETIFVDAFYLFNANGIQDHDFEVFLNGISIGSKAGATFPLLSAKIWSKDKVVNKFWEESFLGGIFFPGLTDVTYETADLDTNLFINGINELRLQTIATNNTDNFGHLYIVRLRKNQIFPGTFNFVNYFLINSYFNSSLDPITLNYPFNWYPIP